MAGLAHSMRHTYRSGLDAVGTPVAVQQKLMRHSGICTIINIYGDVVTDEMAVASGKVAGWDANLLKNGGSEWESNPPSPS